MNIPGKKIKRIRWVHTPQYVVSVEVEAVVPDADPSEACFPPETLKLLREVEERAKSGDVGWLHQHGRVYRVLDAA